MEPPAKFPKFPSTKVLKEVIGGSLETEIVIHYVKSELWSSQRKQLHLFLSFHWIVSFNTADFTSTRL